MKKFFQEFKAFALRGNVIDLAVGVIIGAAFQSVVKSLTDDLLSPLIGMFAKTDLTGLTLTLGGTELRYGAFLTAVINFLIMAFLIFLLVKGMNRLSRIGKHEEEKKAPDTKPCPFCCSNIPLAATRCPHCTSLLEEATSPEEA